MTSLCPRVQACAFTLLFLLVAGAGPAEAKRYSADSFDSRVEVLDGGTLRVIETVVFRFEDGTFTEVFREIPARRTDGIEFVSAAMDGVPFPEGEGQAGRVEVRRDGELRVTWHFEPRTNTTHAFELVYVVRGAVREEAGTDLLAWRPLPSEHKYRIATSTTDIVLPVPPLVTPVLETRRLGHASLTVEDTQIRIQADTIRSNGRFDVLVRMPPGSVVHSAPLWQQRQRAHQELAPRWLLAAGLTLLLGVIALFAVRRGYDVPPHDSTTPATGPGLPDTLPAPEAGALLTNGSARIEHAMAAIFALAERGEVTIEEEPRGTFGQRRFVITRRAARRPVGPYEQVLLDAIFTTRGRTEARVTIDKARSRMSTRVGRFHRALEAELQGQGLIDAGRREIRNRFARLGIVLILVAAVLPIPLAIFGQERFGLWPLFVPLAIAVVALIAFICQSAHTPLSNEGVRRARYWRGFKAYLKAVTDDEVARPAGSPDRLLPFVVALGLASPWSKYMKQHRIEIPSWFHATAPGDSAPAFLAFVAYGGATSSGGGGGGGGVSAGGGASGAS